MHKPKGEFFWPNGQNVSVITKYFQGNKFEGFIRKLNRWGFKRVTGTGLPHGAQMYRHGKFHRGKPELLKQMITFKEERHWKEQLIWQEPLSHDLQIADARSLPNTLFESHTPSSMFFADRRSQSSTSRPSPGRNAVKAVPILQYVLSCSSWFYLVHISPFAESNPSNSRPLQSLQSSGTDNGLFATVVPCTFMHIKQHLSY
jgi:hypothetical protein